MKPYEKPSKTMKTQWKPKKPTMRSNENLRKPTAQTQNERLPAPAPARFSSAVEVQWPFPIDVHDCKRSKPQDSTTRLSGWGLLVRDWCLFGGLEVWLFFPKKQVSFGGLVKFFDKDVSYWSTGKERSFPKGINDFVPPRCLFSAKQVSSFGWKAYEAKMGELFIEDFLSCFLSRKQASGRGLGLGLVILPWFCHESKIRR